MTKQMVTFHIGQRVVCVDATPNRLFPVKVLTRGRIYTIRAVDQRPGWKAPGWGVHLEGIYVFYPGHGEWAIHPRRFRPVTERPTSIAVFKKLLDKQLTLPLSEEGLTRFRPSSATATLATGQTAERCRLPREPGAGAARVGSRPSRLLARVPSHASPVLRDDRTIVSAVDTTKRVLQRRRAYQRGSGLFQFSYVIVLFLVLWFSREGSDMRPPDIAASIAPDVFIR
jgi:hypothetical protein